LFAFDAKSKGIGIERTVMVDSHNAARVTFDNVGIDAGALIGDLDNGWGVLDAALDAGRAALASEMLGAADEVFEHTVAYLRERKQFGKVIGQFQALQHRAANLYCELEVARSAILRGSQALDETPDRAAAIVSIAKAKAGSTATLAVQEGVQMHGGIGMTDEFDMGFFMKRVRVTNELFGDSSFHADRLARMNRY
jgi:alkylation response protein AidB-like acyl-CoA dehydrogenase